MSAIVRLISGWKAEGRRGAITSQISVTLPDIALSRVKSPMGVPFMSVYSLLLIERIYNVVHISASGKQRDYRHRSMESAVRAHCPLFEN